MPRFRAFQPDGGQYVLKGDRSLPPDEQVTWSYLDPLPSQIAKYESRLGWHEFGSVRVDRDAAGGGVSGEAEAAHWVSNSAAVSIRVLLDCLTDVAGPGPSGPLEYPAKGTDTEKERFLARFVKADLYEVADYILGERSALTEDEAGN